MRAKALPKAILLLAASAVLVAVACGPAAPIVEGKVLKAENGGMKVTVADEATGEMVTLELNGAEMGSPPEPGHVVRIVYRADGAANKALRVMNLTHAEKLGSSGH